MTSIGQDAGCRRPGGSRGLPVRTHGVALPDAAAIDVETLRGRRAVHRWERTSIGDVFERLTWSRPDQVAIAAAEGACGDERFAQVTYREADEAANRLAHSLGQAGLAPGDRVLMFCDNTVEAILAKIGIAKAGMVATPLNPNLAPDAIEHLVRLTQPRFAIVDAELWPRLAGVAAATGLRIGATITVGGGPIPGAPAFGDLVEGAPATETDNEIHGDDIFQLLFTSGTTAMPKGVMLSHSYTHLAALNFALSLTRGLRYESELRVCAFLPMTYHIGETLFTYSTFLAGGTLTIGRRLVPGPFLKTVAESGSTAMGAGSPELTSALAAEMDARPELDLSALTILVYSWGALSPSLIRRFENRAAPGFSAVGIFGQTEAIACHRFWPSEAPELDPETSQTVNYVGVPSGMLASDVVDDNGESVRGAPGEVIYRSPIMAAGYYGDPVATREAFRGGWFHSGDSVIVEKNGRRMMVDRYKDIVKTAGESVSSVRVEAVLHQHPEVLRAAVIGLPHKVWGEAVTALVVRRKGATPAPEMLIAFCRERLAGYETPKAVLFTDALPETVGGKVLKYKLRAAYADFYDVRRSRSA